MGTSPRFETVIGRLRALWAQFSTYAHSRHAPLAVFVWSFLNPLLIPFPAESLLAPIALVNRTRAVFLLALASVATTLGAVVGYLASAFLYDTLVQPLVAGLDIEASLATLASAAEPLTVFWIVFVAALTLIPDPPFIAAAGVLRVDLFTFTVAFFLGRTLRFIIIVGLVLLFGKQAWVWFENTEQKLAWVVALTALVVLLLALLVIVLH